MIRIGIKTLFSLLLLSVICWAQVPYDTSPDWLSNESTEYGTGSAFDDVNNDGFIDLAISNGNDMSLDPNYVYINQNGILPTSASWTSSDYKYSGHCEFGDVDGDGYPELMVANYISSGWGPSTVQIYYNADGSMETSPYWETADSFYSFRASFGDADGDGDLDLAVATGEAYNAIYQQNRIYYNIDGALQTTPGWLSMDSDACYDVHWIDIENDGDLDLAFQTSGGPVKIYYNSGSSIAVLPGWESSGNDNGNSFDFADVNNDGFVDLGVSCNTQLSGSGRNKIYLSNNGILNTTPYWQSSSTGYGSEAVFSDVDNDGDYDFLTGRWWGLVFVYLNNSGSFHTSPDWTSSSSYESVIENITFADVNNGMDDYYTIVFDGDGQTKLFYLDDHFLQSIDYVKVDGSFIPATSYCYSLADGWVSLGSAPVDNVVIYYRNSPHKDLAISNWDGESYVFTNTNDDPPVLIGMVPDSPPVVVPAGGNFSFTGILINSTGQSQTPDVAIYVRLPNSSLYGPIELFNNIPMAPYDSLIYEGVVQDIPGYALLGDYQYVAYCGDFPSNPYDSAQFDFTITSGLGGDSDDWNVSAWFSEEDILIPQATKLIGNYPNPFNAQTTIVFNLYSDSHVD
ncbi:MAG: VCBS repeat-containing protein, partial [candidate division Zixibacteria bacterium]|nr:VCBS repeat-containing protein [candidate division Zixibacteria bacterium]